MAGKKAKVAVADVGIAREMRRKFIAAAMVAVALVLAGIVGGLAFAVYTRLCSVADAQLEALAESGGSFERLIAEKKDDFGSSSESAPRESSEDADDPPSQGLGAVTTYDFGFSEETPYEMRFFSVVLDESGEMVSVDISRIVSVDAERAVEHARNAQASGTDSGFIGDLRYLVVEQDDGTSLCIFLDCSRDLASLRSMIITSLVVAIVALALVFVLVLVFSKRAVAPVVESYERQRRFITDASHDLKTPLAVIDSSADVLEIENGPSEWTDSIHSQVERMSDLTNKLVVLARMDEGPGTLTLTDFDMGELARKVADDFEPVAVAGDHEIVCEPGGQMPCHADIALSEQAISLLMDNALKYAPEGAPVRISCEKARKGRVRVTVENACEPLDPGEHPELFERFYRSDESRTSGAGNGIGLAVVRAIAEAHGGSVQAMSPDGTSLRISITL